MAKKAAKPQHTPSAKLALDDVLKSLQDLIRNDLTDGASNATADASALTPAALESDLGKPRPSTQEMIQELEAGLAELSLPLMDPGVSTATATHASPRDTDTPDKALVLSSKPEMTLPISAPSKPPSTSKFIQDPTPSAVEIASLENVVPAPQPLANSEFLQDEPATDSEIASLDNVTLDFGNHSGGAEIEWDQRLSDTPNTSPAPSFARTPELELPSLVPSIEKTVAPPTPQVVNKKTPNPSTPVGRPKARGGILTQGLQAELPLPEPLAPTALTQPNPERTIPAFVPDDALPRPSLGSWDDIPVLQDTVEVAETTVAAPAIKPRDQAHRMAIQIAARLNVELRRAGKHPLGTDIITRLVHLLQETLAQSTPNVDNKPQR